MQPSEDLGLCRKQKACLAVPICRVLGLCPLKELTFIAAFEDIKVGSQQVDIVNAQIKRVDT
jgi:hypothetical protein